MTELDEIRKRTEGHTPGPWREFDREVLSDSGVVFHWEPYEGGYFDKAADFDLAVAAPDLLRIVTEQEAELAKAVMLLREIRTFLINGIDMGYIYLPEDFDSASKTLPKLNDYLARQEAK